MTCSHSHFPHRVAVRAAGKKTGVIHLGATCHREFIIITHAHIIKKPRMGAGEPDQGRLKNGGYSYGKSRPFSVPTEQKRSQGDRKCSQELYEATQKYGKLNLNHEIKGP